MGRILINNIDIEEYGVKVLNDYIKDLLNPPDKEDITSIEWYEGQFDVDLSDGIQFKEEKEIKLECYQDDFSKNFQTFFDVLSSQPYNLFTFEEIGLNLRLRLLKIENNNVLSGFNKQTFKITLVQDDFDETFTDNHIYFNFVDSACFIENNNVNDYGFILLEGSLDKIFERTIQDRLVGAKHSLTIKAIEEDLSFGSSTMDVEQFKINFNSFIGLVTSAGSKSLVLRYDNQEYKMQCFYNNIAINSLLLNNGKVWVTFTLKVAITEVASESSLATFRALSHRQLNSLVEGFRLVGNQTFSIYLKPLYYTDETIETLDVILFEDNEQSECPFNVNSFSPCNIVEIPNTEHNREILSRYEIYVFAGGYLHITNYYTEALRSSSHGEITELNNDFSLDSSFSIFLQPKFYSDDKMTVADVMLVGDNEISEIPININCFTPANISVFPATSTNKTLLQSFRVFYFITEQTIM
ncbi:MAG: hypothetical protein J6P44_02430 [Bacteroidales bacterium]|nr:hypothetical protein [Bacteroidales bacterium]